jgi:hypothetical protein
MIPWRESRRWDEVSPNNVSLCPIYDPLSNASLGRCFPWSMRPLDDASLHDVSGTMGTHRSKDTSTEGRVFSKGQIDKGTGQSSLFVRGHIVMASTCSRSRDVGLSLDLRRAKSWKQNKELNPSEFVFERVWRFFFDFAQENASLVINLEMYFCNTKRFCN